MHAAARGLYPAAPINARLPEATPPLPPQHLLTPPPGTPGLRHPHTSTPLPALIPCNEFLHAQPAAPTGPHRALPWGSGCARGSHHSLAPMSHCASVSPRTCVGAGVPCVHERAPCELAAKAAISQPAEPPTPPGDSHQGARKVPEEPHRLVGKPSTMMPPLLLLLLLLGPAMPCSPQPNATRFVCTEPTLSTFPTGLPPTTLAVSVEFTALATLLPTALAGLPRLQELHLSSNRLTTLPETLLRPVPALRVLDLTDNLLAHLPPDVFSGTGHLRHLVLRGNRLRELQPAWFRRLLQLQWLNLAANALAEVPPAVFRPLRSLRSLDLSHNRLASLAPGALAGLRALEQLDLEGNRLGTLPPDAFAPVPALRLLFLQRNELRALPAGVFVPLRHLRVLDLARNQLRALELPPRPPGPTLDLDISGNPWACECPLLALLRQAAPRLTAARDTLCASPARYRGREVAAVSRAGDTGCEPEGDGQRRPEP
ncbi:leucine-rich alpha-2-glycoprotein [Rhynochetos jubatus]